jgi:hypothetical protein
MVDPSGLAGEKEPKPKVPTWIVTGEDVQNFLEVAAKCSYAAYNIQSELALVAVAGVAAGTAPVTFVTAGLAISAVGLAWYNLEHAQQAIVWCLGGPAPTAPSAPVP